MSLGESLGKSLLEIDAMPQSELVTWQAYAQIRDEERKLKGRQPK